MLRKNAWDWIQTVLGWPVDVLIWAMAGITAVTDFALGGWTSIPLEKGGVMVFRVFRKLRHERNLENLWVSLAVMAFGAAGIILVLKYAAR